MLNAAKKKKENIVEYILYMWQLEDIIRSCSLDITVISERVISQLEVDGVEREEVYHWYENLIATMQKENIATWGHLSEINEIVKELEQLHNGLLNVFQDAQYIRVYEVAQENINTLKNKSSGSVKSDVQACLNGLYGVLLLRLQKKEISKETQDAIQSISALMAILAKKYKSKPNLELDKVISN